MVVNRISYALHRWILFMKKNCFPLAETVLEQDFMRITIITYYLWSAKLQVLFLLKSIQNSNRLKPFYKGMITNGLVTVPLVPGLYLVSTYRSGGYKISSLSIVNIQAQDGSFIETLVKGVDYDSTIEMKYTERNISFQYKISLSGGCTIVIFKLV